MPSLLESVLAFLAEQRARQAPVFPAVKQEKVLSFMATTSRPGYGAVSVHRLHGLEAGPTPRELRVALAGALPRAPGPGECVTVHLTRPEQYQGYQVKTLPLGEEGARTPEALATAGGDRLTVNGAHLYTVHHSPYTLRFFEAVPLADVRALAGSLRHAIVAVGEAANVSPRFVYHQEVRDGRLALYHGDGLALKTYMNLRTNPRETRLLLDLDSYRGWALRGPVEEFAPAEHPEAYDRICRGFTSGGWGRPSRVFRFTAEELAPLEPQG